MKNFWSTFLACLLALVVANMVIGVFLVMVLAGIGTLFSETVPDVQQKTVLRLDFAEPISDDPSRNPLSEMGFNDLMSMPGRPQLRFDRRVESYRDGCDRRPDQRDLPECQPKYGNGNGYDGGDPRCVVAVQRIREIHR